MKNIFNIVLAFLAFSMVLNVLIQNTKEDLRKSILSSLYNEPKKEQFKVFHFLFKKKYDLNSEEGLMRYKIFKSNLRFIQETNSKNLTYKLGLNDFADLTDEEFEKKYMTIFPIEKFNEEMQKFLNTPKQKKINFDLMGDQDEIIINQIKSKSNHQVVQQQIRVDYSSALNPARDQEFCGSCWAFASVCAIEANYNLKYGNSPIFSEQELVDCDPKNYDCFGGWPDNSFEYIIKHGLAYAAEYPYVSGANHQKDICRSSSTARNMVVESYEFCHLFDCPKDQFYSMLQKGPIAVTIDADGGTEAAKYFKYYTEGIIESMPCKRPTHVVVLFGSDYDEKGQYFQARNSWGDGWGVNGNFKIRVDPSNNTCFMESYAVLPIVKQAINPIPVPPKPGCLKIFSECESKGEVLEICQNTVNIENFPVMRGFDIGKFKTVRLFFDDEKCKGHSYTLDRSTSCFETNGLPMLVNSIKSVIIEDDLPEKGCIWVFDNSCKSGEKLEICDDITDLNRFNFGNKISSIKFGEGVDNIIIYLDPFYKGGYATLSHDVNSFDGSWLDNDIESIKLFKK